MKSKFDLGFIFSLALLTVGSVCHPHLAMAKTERAESGKVRAEFSYDEAEYCIENLKLKVIRDGQTLLEQPLSPENGACRFSGLQVRNLDANPEPEVIVDLYTGGAHCCNFSVIYRYDSARKEYTSVEHWWGNTGYEFKDLNQDTIPEFNSYDDRFAYAFASYAGSSYPLQIWQYRDGKMVDITRSYPELIYNDAYQLWQRYSEYKNEYPEVGRGALAAYLADKYLLGQSEDGWQRVRQAYQESDRESFFADLRKFLQETGYIITAGQTEFYQLAQLERMGIYNKCPQGTRLNTAGETANYRFALCDGDGGEYYLGESKNSSESITVKHRDGDPDDSFRRGDTVYRIGNGGGESADMYLEVWQGNRQLLREMVQKVYRR